MIDDVIRRAALIENPNVERVHAAMSEVAAKAVDDFASRLDDELCARMRARASVGEHVIAAALEEVVDALRRIR